MRRSGFTLIELIVVLIILGILAALLFPIFQRPHGGHGRRAACQSNLKQIALGFKQYIQDYDEKYPIARNSRTIAKPHNWAGSIYPYIKSGDILRCPSDEKAKADEVSYGYNAWIGGRSEKKVSSPAKVILNFEVLVDPNGWTQTGTAPQAVSAATRHLEGANYAFVDGHVKWLKPEKVTALPPSKGQFTFVPG